MARTRTRFHLTTTLASGLVYAAESWSHRDVAIRRAYQLAYDAAKSDAALDTERGHQLCRRAAAWDGIVTMILPFAGGSLVFEPVPQH